MVALILDCSVVAGWCFEDEASRRHGDLLIAVKDDGAVVPVHWPLEVGNMLLHAQRGGRITLSNVDERLELFLRLPIEIEPGMPEIAWGATLSLARTHKLTSYDAGYLELAIRRRMPLATKDKQLARAATREGLTLVEI